MQITFDVNERRYFFKLLMLKASMEQDRKASRFWVDLAEQFATNRSTSQLKAPHLNLLLDIIKSLRQTIITELGKGTVEEKRKITLDNISKLLEAAEGKITPKLLLINPEGE